MHKPNMIQKARPARVPQEGAIMRVQALHARVQVHSVRHGSTSAYYAACTVSLLNPSRLSLNQSA